MTEEREHQSVEELEEEVTLLWAHVMAVDEWVESVGGWDWEHDEDAEKRMNATRAALRRYEPTDVREDQKRSDDGD